MHSKDIMPDEENSSTSENIETIESTDDYIDSRKNKISSELMSFSGPKTEAELQQKIEEIENMYKQVGGEISDKQKMQEEIDFYTNEYKRFNNLKRLESISEILKPEDFELFEKIVGNQEGNIDELFDPHGKVLHATNSTALDIMSDHEINTISGGTRQLGPSLTDGDHEMAITFNLVWGKLKTPGGLDKVHKQIDLDEYPQFESKYNEFVAWAVDRLKKEYGDSEKFEEEKEKLLKKAEEHHEDKSKLHSSEDDYIRELNSMAYGVLRPRWISEGFSEEEAEEKVKQFIAKQNDFKKRFSSRPDNEQPFPVTLSFNKDVLPKLVPEGGEREFEVRTEEEFKFDNASVVFVPEKYLDSELVQKIKTLYPGIDIMAEEELEFIRMIKLLDKKEEEIKVESPFLDEDFDDEEIYIDTPLSAHEFLSLRQTTESKKLYVDKGPEVIGDHNRFEHGVPTILDSDNFVNEFFESNLLNIAKDNMLLDKDKIVIPPIKISFKDLENNYCYYSEYIPNTISSDIYSVDNNKVLHNLTDEHYKKLSLSGEISQFNDENAAIVDRCVSELHEGKHSIPLGLLHLVAGDLDRNYNNYRYQIKNNEDGSRDVKIVVFDFAGGRAGKKTEKGIIGNNLFSNHKIEEILEYWQKIKEFILNTGVVDKILDEISLPQEMKDKKRNEVLNNINNMISLIEEEISLSKV